MQVIVIWMPMLPGDDERAARIAARMFPAEVKQYYDAKNTVGRSYAKDVFADCLKDALSAVTWKDPIEEDLRKWAADPGSRPLWDAVLFYPTQLHWEDQPPTPARWIKQVGFYGPDVQSGPTGSFWVNSCSAGPRESDWLEEVRAAMQEMTPASPPEDSPAVPVNP